MKQGGEDRLEGPHCPSKMLWLSPRGKFWEPGWDTPLRASHSVAWEMAVVIHQLPSDSLEDDFWEGLIPFPSCLLCR